jgi:hypothetical protein
MKCSANNCSVFNNTADEVTISCNGYCKGVFHGCCVGLPRHCASSVSSTTKFIHQHFICEQCMAVPSIIVNFDEIWSSKFKELSNLVSELQNKSMTNIMKNEQAFKELSDHVDAFSNQLIALEQQLIISKPRPSFETSLLQELTTDEPTTTVAVQTDRSVVPESKNDGGSGGEWRMMNLNSKKIWKNDWTHFDKNLISNKSTKSKSHRKSKKQQPKYNSDQFDNYYGILNNFEEPRVELITDHSRDPNFLLTNLKPRKNNAKYRQLQHKNAENFDEILNNYNLQFFEPNRPPTFHSPILQPQSQPAPSNLQKKSKYRQQREKIQKQQNLPSKNVTASRQTQPPSSQQPPQPKMCQRPTFSVPIEVHQPPVSPHLYPQPQYQPPPAPFVPAQQYTKYPNFVSRGTLYEQQKQRQEQQRQQQHLPHTSSFIDPLMPPVVKNTLISAQENGRYALSRLHDSHLLKTVRYFLAYLHDNPDVCHEGFTSAHCKTLIGSKGLPTDIAALKSMYIRYNIMFGNSNEIEVNNELITLRRYLTSSRINHLQRNRENNNKFYNSRNF